VLSNVNWTVVGWTQFGRTADVISGTEVFSFRLGCIGCYFFCLTDKLRCDAPPGALPALHLLSRVRDI